jgi:TatD DNase family protein
MLIDTHCHIHDTDYSLDVTEVIRRANNANVNKMICIGTNVVDSKLAIDFASKHDNIYATIGIHPHYTGDNAADLEQLINYGSKKIVAIGEIGLDYFNMRNSRQDQIELLESQIELALKYDLPIVFHARDAYEDFWPIFDNFDGIRGELHCFTDSYKNAQEALKRGLYIGVNGIITFTKDEAQKKMFRSLPMDKILLETDAPFLTPVPFRGKINEPAFVKNIAEYLKVGRQISFDEIERVTTANALSLFNLTD